MRLLSIITLNYQQHRRNMRLNINNNNCVNVYMKNKPDYKCLACSTAELLHEVILDLLQPLQPIIDLQVNLRLLEMVPNDSPYPKHWV